MSTAVMPIQIPAAVDTAQLPQPQGFYILVKVRKAPKMVGSFYVPETRVADEDMASPMSEVVLMGPECYQDAKVFPGGPRCQVGDIILMAPYAGQRFLFGAGSEPEEYRIITDAVVAATVPNPDLVRRNL